jgi:heme/copper-type cytochrome/quinol oxidase subunit 2
MRKILIVVAMVLVAGFIFSACQGGAASTPKTQTFDIGIGHQDAYARDALVDAGAPAETRITTFYRWEPPVLVVNKGDTVVLNVTNYSHSRVHSFVLAAFYQDTGRIANAPEGVERTIKTLEFVADEAGVFEWKCGVPPDPTATPKECSAEHKYQKGWLIVLDR